MSFERKYIAPGSVAPRVAARLAHCLPADPEFPLDEVHSVYFDSPEQTALDEVANGDFHKTKVRVRWYGSTGPAAAYVECKRKLGARRSKQRVPVQGVDPRLPLHHPGWSRAVEPLRSVDFDLPRGQLEPTLHLRYRRRRFVEPESGVRVAVDDRIQTVSAHPRWITAVSPAGHAIPWTVVECKGNERTLPEKLTWLGAFGLRRASFSKYGLIRDPS